MKFNRHLLLAAASALLWALPAAAQTAPQASGGLENIVVTARKREETLISTPVVVSALSAQMLSNYAITTLSDVSRMVPMLMLGSQGGSIQGGNVVLRGIAGPDSNPFGDQAVSFNIDGVQVSFATVLRMADTDIGQVEVLKGPQALFYGKNSPAGIVSIHSADPTNHLEARAEIGYEGVGEEVRGEGYISGPINDAFSARLAGFYAHTQGWLPDPTYKTNSPYAIDHPDDGRESDWAIRGTVKYDPGSKFDAKLKANYAETHTDGPANVNQTNCANGVSRATGSGLPCGQGNYATNPSSGPIVGTIPATLNYFGNGQGFLRQKQFLGSLEANYQPSDPVKLTSVTGYYWSNMQSCQNYENDTTIILPSCGVLYIHQFSEELRATTDYQGAVNFAAGGYYGHTTAGSGSFTYLFGGNFPLNLLGTGTDGGPNTPYLLNNYYLTQVTNAYSAYLQMIYKPIDVIEVDAGGRYSYEKKAVTLKDGGGLQEGILPGKFILDSSTITPVPRPNRSWSDFSPEVTISYRPSHDLTVFASYKHGFLSGGFNSSSNSFALAPDIGYDPETIKGFEAGIKTLLLDETLSFNVAAYTYKGSGLQVTNFQNSTSTIHNAADATIKGAEMDFNYKTMMDGLGLHGAAAYNKAKYTNFPNAPCYNGQSPALGCNVNGNSAQNISGMPIPRAPEWNLNGGITYETPIASSLKLTMSGDAIYSSSYLTDATDAPQSRQKAYTLLNFAVHLSNEADVWKISFIGKNLTDRHYFVAEPNVPFTGTNGGVVPAVLGDRFGNAASRGRELWVKVAYKFNGQ